MGENREPRQVGGAGGIGLTALVWLGVTVLIIYATVALGFPQYRMRLFREQVREIAKLSDLSDAQVIERVLEEAEGLGVPIGEEDIEIRRVRGTEISLRVAWDEEISLFDYPLISRGFEVSAPEKFSPP